MEDISAKTRNQRKTLRKISKKIKKQQTTENQKNAKYRKYKLSETYILDLSCISC